MSWVDRMGTRATTAKRHKGPITYEHNGSEKATHLADNKRNTSGNLNLGLTVSLQSLT